MEMAVMLYPFHSLCDYLSTVTGFEVDKLRYIVLWGLSIPLAFVMHYALPPSKVGTAVRHCYATSLGILMGVLCFGWGVCTLFAAVLVGYLLLLVVPPRLVHKVTMVYIIGVIGAAHVYRMLTDYGGYHLDFTGPLMIIVQKISLSAFAVHDGQARREAELNADQRKNMLKSVPAVLDYLSYCFNFLQFLAGPTCTFREYQMFIDGTNFAIDNPNRFARADLHSRAPSTILPWLQPFLFSLLLMGLFVYLAPLFPTEDFVNPRNSLLHTLLTFYPCFFAQRCKYYFSWKLTESINNAAGMGFSGYDEKDGTPQWNLAVNCTPLGFELGSSPRVAIDSWNTTTSVWLRRVCYERVPFQPMVLSFLLSAYWHGFYPNYYACFVMVATLVQVARKGRRLFRPHFLGSKAIKLLYDILTTLATGFYVTSQASTFLYMEWADIITCHSQFYFVHDIILVVFLLLPVKAARPKKEELSKEKEKTESRTAGGSVEGEDRHTLRRREQSGEGDQDGGQGARVKLE